MIKNAQSNIAFGSHGQKGWSSLVLFFLLLNFRLYDQDRVTYLVYKQVVGMGVSLSFLTRFRLLVWMTGDLVDLYPREKHWSECMVEWG